MDSNGNNPMTGGTPQQAGQYSSPVPQQAAQAGMPTQPSDEGTKEYIESLIVFLRVKETEMIQQGKIPSMGNLIDELEQSIL